MAKSSCQKIRAELSCPFNLYAAQTWKYLVGEDYGVLSCVIMDVSPSFHAEAYLLQALRFLT